MLVGKHGCHIEPPAVAPGRANVLHVLSNGTVVDGTTYAQGHCSDLFEVAGNEFPVACSASDVAFANGRNFEAKLEGDETAIYFPISMVVDPAISQDVDVVFTANVYEAFRWSDVEGDGFAEGIFDASMDMVEPVESFGPNAYDVGFE